MNTPHLITAVNLALANDWDGAHKIAQDYSDPMANWIHAVLHKIEGDVWNSKYWYARTAGKQYEDYTEAKDELLAIMQYLQTQAQK
jgi:hypothetical protein